VTRDDVNNNNNKTSLPHCQQPSGQQKKQQKVQKQITKKNKQGIHKNDTNKTNDLPK
jgi:hypothetical protein